MVYYRHDNFCKVEFKEKVTTDFKELGGKFTYSWLRNLHIHLSHSDFHTKIHCHFVRSRSKGAICLKIDQTHNIQLDDRIWVNNVEAK